MPETAPTDETQRYQLGECIGRGGLGAVYRAWDARLGRWVAVKRLSIDPALGADDIEEKMRREANALAALQHPNVVTIYDFRADEEGPFVVMEFIEGETLDAFVERAPFDCASFRELAEQTLAGVAAAHRAGLLHRDLKPGNIMLAASASGPFQVKILDFGLAKFAPKPVAQTIDQADSLFGSIYFMAPEQFRRAALDVRTDLYALGCVFYYTLTGRQPFAGETVAETVASHLQHEVRDLAQLRPDLPSAVAGWVMRLLSLSPADRPATAAEALTNLRAVARDGASGFPGEPPGRAHRRVASLWLAGISVAVAAGIAGYFLWHGTAPARRANASPLPSVSLFANVPAAYVKGQVPGCFTILRSGDTNTALTVSYLINGSAKNGVDYATIPKEKTIRPGEASEKILIVPVDEKHRTDADRHVKLMLVPASTYTVATPEEVKLKILYEH